MNVLIKEILWNHHTLLGFCLQLASLLRRFMNTQQTALTFQENVCTVFMSYTYRLSMSFIQWTLLSYLMQLHTDLISHHC